jgi:hypothetical protein
MRSNKALGVVGGLLALALAACAGAWAEPVTSPADRTAFVVLEAPPFPAGSVTSFRRVNLAAHRFEPGGVDVALSPSTRINVGSHSRTVLLGRSFPPGDYALVQVRGRTFNDAGTGTASLCMNAAAPVFRFAAGQIAIIRTNYMPSFRGQIDNRAFTENEAVEDEFAHARWRYPAIVGAATVADPVEVIMWSEPTSDSCDPPDGFSEAPP